MEKTNYYDVDRLSNSDMTHLLKSTAHYKHYKMNKQEPTPEMEFGSALHTLILEPEKFKQEYSFTNLDKRTKAYKEFESENIDKKILSFKDLDLLNSMFEAIKESSAYELITDDSNIYEKELFFDYNNEIACKGKLDILNLNKSLIIDLKTTKDALNVDKTIINFHYYRQEYFYKYAVKQIYDIDCEFYFIFVEKEAPFGVRVIDTFGFENIAEREINLAVERYKEYLENPNKNFKVYDENISTIFKPAWLI